VSCNILISFVHKEFRRYVTPAIWYNIVKLPTTLISSHWTAMCIKHQNVRNSEEKFRSSAIWKFMGFLYTGGPQNKFTVVTRNDDC
jgi:hypothetical protein